MCHDAILEPKLKANKIIKVFSWLANIYKINCGINRQ